MPSRGVALPKITTKREHVTPKHSKQGVLNSLCEHVRACEHAACSHVLAANTCEHASITFIFAKTNNDQISFAKSEQLKNTDGEQRKFSGRSLGALTIRPKFRDKW